MNNCTACPHAETAFNQIKTIGNSDDCELLLVGDYPRPNDDALGKPYAGGQYSFLFELLDQIGVKYKVTYLLKCIPINVQTRQYIVPNIADYSTCIENRFKQEIQEFKPSCILALGQEALNTLLGKECKIGDYRERAIDYNIGDFTTKLLATYSPLYIARNLDNEITYKRFVEDIVYACRHAMTPCHEGRLRTITVDANQFERIAEIWCANDSIEYVSFDTESNGLEPWIHGSKITSFSVAVDDYIGYNIFLYHPELEISDDERNRIIDSAKKLLTQKKVVAHHAKHEHRFCKECWKFTPNITEDTMYMSYVLFMSYPGISHGLKYLSGRFISLPPWEEYTSRYIELFKSLKRNKSIDDTKVEHIINDLYPDLNLSSEEVYRFFNIIKDPTYYIKHAESDESDIFMWMIPVRVLEKYAGMDAIAPLRLMKVLKPKIQSDEGLLKTYTMMVKGAEVFANIELKGVRVYDIDTWNRLYEEKAEQKLAILRGFDEVKQFELENSTEYNPGSSKQNIDVFFNRFRFPVVETTSKGDPATSEPVLISLIKQYRDLGDEASERKLEFLNNFRDYKKLKKIITAYWQGLKRFTHYNDAFDGHSCSLIPVPDGEEDMHMHPGYTLHGTDSGRLSSQNPSIHTIPYRSDVKRIIVPHHHKRGGIFVMADQSQLEIRVLACIVEAFYGDSSLANAYREGRDIHRYNAGKIFKKPDEEVVDAERRFAKTISFSLLYGASEKSVSESTGRTLEECKQLFESFYEAFPGIRKFINAMHEYASKYGCVRTPFGRIKYLLDALHPEDGYKYSQSLRQAQNVPIQSAGSDLSFLSIVYADNYMRMHELKSKIVAFIHDSITIDAFPGELFESIDLLKYSMKTLLEQLDWVRCPLGIDIDLSDNMGDHCAIKDMDIHEDGSRTLTLKGYDYVINNVVQEASFSYNILEDILVEEHEFLEDPGDLVARKSMNLSYDNKTFNEQTRKITLIKS